MTGIGIRKVASFLDNAGWGFCFVGGLIALEYRDDVATLMRFAIYALVAAAVLVSACVAVVLHEVGRGVHALELARSDANLVEDVQIMSYWNGLVACELRLQGQEPVPVVFGDQAKNLAREFQVRGEA